MEISNLYQLFLTCNGFTTDSRECQQNFMFIALKGESFNGSAFAVKALENGCSYVVIDDPTYFVEDDKRYILVDDSLKTLQSLANYHRHQFNIPIIGITGTNGKTTTKELISAVLSQKYNVLSTIGNLNNHIGVPLTLLRLTKEHDLAVIEMGANHPGEIDYLVHIAEPDYGIITNVGKGHLEGFGSFEGVKKTKGELYNFLRQNPTSIVFIDHNNPHLLEMAKGMNLLEYGSNNNLYIHGQVIDNSPYLSFKWKANDEEKEHNIQTNLIGEYNLTNALAAITIGHFFKVESTAISKAIEEYTPQNNRSQLKKTKENILIIDAYNANPTSMMAALTNFQKMNMPHKLLILGDMRELGDESEAEHQKVIDYINQTPDFEKVILVGELFANAKHTYQSYKNVDELITALHKTPLSGKTILIKGSNGIRLNKVVDYLND